MSFDTKALSSYIQMYPISLPPFVFRENIIHIKIKFKNQIVAQMNPPRLGLGQFNNLGQNMKIFVHSKKKYDIQPTDVIEVILEINNSQVGSQQIVAGDYMKPYPVPGELQFGGTTLKFELAINDSTSLSINNLSKEPSQHKVTPFDAQKVVFVGGFCVLAYYVIKKLIQN